MSELREVVVEVLRSLTPYYSAWELEHGVDGEDLYRRLEDAYADSLEDPIWWCFKHDQSTIVELRCDIGNTDCDIAKATRPQRL